MNSYRLGARTARRLNAPSLSRVQELWRRTATGKGNKEVSSAGSVAFPPQSDSDTEETERPLAALDVDDRQRAGARLEGGAHALGVARARSLEAHAHNSCRCANWAAFNH